MKRNWFSLRVSTALFFAALIPNFAYSDETLPRVVSADLQEINTYTFSAQSQANQSGERLVVDAILFGGDTAVSQGNALATVTDTFSLRIPSGTIGQRLCFDLSGDQQGSRKMSLLELVKPTGKIVARIETDPGRGTGSRGGAIIVAYPAEDGSKEPREACLLQGDWLYPASLDSPDTNNRVLQLRVNTGGSDATIVQVSDGLANGQPRSCERAESENGLFNRVCRLPLTAASNGIAQIRLTVRQRNANPIRKVFNVVVSETKQ